MDVPRNVSKKETLLKLIAKSGKIEAKLKEFDKIFAANGNVGAHRPILDEKEIPPSDADVLLASQRRELKRLQYIHAALSERIEEIMYELDTEANHGKAPSPNATTFATINSVSPGSPAEECGLRVGDQIIEFGSINSKNFTGELKEMAKLVSHLQNQRIIVKIKRDPHVLKMHLVPKIWSGGGLMGCSIAYKYKLFSVTSKKVVVILLIITTVVICKRLFFPLSST